MKEIKVCIPRVEDVKEFNAACCRSICNIDVGTGRYVVDGKSILGLYSLDLSKPVLVSVHGEESEIAAFKSDIARFTL